MFVWIGILVLLVAVIVAAYFGARTWHWAHVTLVVFVFLAAVGYLVLAAEVLRINAILRADAKRQEASLKETEARIEALKRGTKDSLLLGQLAAKEVQIPEGATEIKSLGDLNHELDMETRLRGRVWRKVTPAGFDAATETLKIAVESPTPSGIDKDSIVYLFEEGEPTNPDPTKGPQFLGEFRVTDAAGQQATLVSVQQLDDFEKQRIARSRGGWSLYETMPVDRYDLFRLEGLSEEQLNEEQKAQLKEQLKKWLPEKSIQEYLRQGTPATKDDDDFRRVGFDEQNNIVGPDKIATAAKVLYYRRLRDFAAEFDALARQRIVMLADMAAVTKDNERLKSSLASAKETEAFRLEEKRKLGIDLAGVVKEREIMEKHLALVQQQLANAKQLLAQALAENRRLADQLAGRHSAPTGPGASGAPARGPLALGNVN